MGAGGCSVSISGAVWLMVVGEPAGVRDSGGGGVSSSMSGRSRSSCGVDGLLPFVRDDEPASGLPCGAGVESAERPRMMPSSTSRFLDSMMFLRLVRV